jgi:hypothetical protein
MTEINAYMNGYQPEGDTEFLVASLDAHKKAIKECQQKVERLEKFYTYFSEMYGIGLEVANWHANGETEPFDNFFDSAEQEMNETEEKE